MAGARVVIGVGNPDRGDDAVGRIVARQLRGRVSGDVGVVEHDGDVAGLLEWLERADAVVLVDAAASGAEAGVIHRFDAHDGALPRTAFALSTHGFGPAEAVELARAMNRLPARCVIFAVEGAAFEIGRPLSAPVAAAAREVAERVLAELAQANVERRS